ncbi:MAG TPA: 30S ribosomal protein S17 [Dehalococcoidia bacterium]|nr:30S ribosomal protein S17 [Dehalococcoidia bacterium]
MDKKRKIRTGKVVSTKMQKTVIVEVMRLVRHPLYKKVMRRTKNYKAHDEKNACHLGDMVKIEETRPLSKDKRWRVLEILRVGNVAEISPADIADIETEVK